MKVLLMADMDNATITQIDRDFLLRELLSWEEEGWGNDEEPMGYETWSTEQLIEEYQSYNDYLFIQEVDISTE